MPAAGIESNDEVGIHTRYLMKSGFIPDIILRTNWRDARTEAISPRFVHSSNESIQR